MEDLFKSAGIDPTNVSTDCSSALPQGGEKRKNRGGHEREEPTTLGGHNLCRVIRARDGDGEQVVVQRPKSTFASSIPAQFMESATGREFDTQSDVVDEGNTYYDEYEEDDYEDDMDESEDDEGTAATPRTGNVMSATVAPSAPSPVQVPKPPPVQAPLASQPIPLTSIKPDSKLGQAAVDVFTMAGFNLQREFLTQPIPVSGRINCFGDPYRLLHRNL